MFFLNACLGQNLPSSYTAGKQPESNSTCVGYSIDLEYLHFYMPLSYVFQIMAVIWTTMMAISSICF